MDMKKLSQHKHMAITGKAVPPAPVKKPAQAPARLKKGGRASGRKC